MSTPDPIDRPATGERDDPAEAGTARVVHDHVDGLERLAVDAYTSGLDAAVPGGDAFAHGPAVLDVALAARRPYVSLVSPAVPSSAAELFASALDDVGRLARSLDAASLVAPTWLGADVRSLLAHLVGQLDRLAERLDARRQGLDAPIDVDYDHWASTAPRQAALATADGARLADALHAAGERVAALVAPRGAGDEPLDRLVDVQVKAFETWMHADDVRLALGRPVTRPAPAGLLALCELATSLVPAGMQLVGRARPGRTVRIVLTGPGGGTWRAATTPGGEAAAGDDAVLVADAVTFCRLFHRQVDAAVVPLHIEGDADLVADVLAGAQAFAERT